MPKPTILAFHGSGSNDTIHTVQMARLTKNLKEYFQIESLSGPLECAAGPGILPFFNGCGPYYRWTPPTEAFSAAAVAKTKSATPQDTQMMPETSALIEAAVNRAHARGSKVVGAIGFSQGTRVVAGLLKASQIRRELEKKGKGENLGLDWLDFSFGVSMCSSFPPALLPASIAEAVKNSGLDEEEQTQILERKIGLPVLHVLGNQDEWRWAGKLLIEKAFEADPQVKSEVQGGQGGMYMFDMGHHYPVQPEDTQKIVDWVLDTWVR